MRSPGRPEPSRAVQREFWRLIATGITTVQAAELVGVSAPVGIRSLLAAERDILRQAAEYFARETRW